MNDNESPSVAPQPPNLFEDEAFGHATILAAQNLLNAASQDLLPAGAVAPQPDPEASGFTTPEEQIAFLKAYAKGNSAATILTTTQATKEHTVTKAQAEVYKYRATHDELTGLLNKATWKEDLQRRIHQGSPFGIGFLDLNSFKKVNDIFGHEVGDALLQSFSSFLQDKFKRQHDAISHEKLFQEPVEGDDDGLTGRYGGDEFGITYSLNGKEEAPSADRRTQPTTIERMDQEIGYLREAMEEFRSMQTKEIQDVGFDIAVGYAVWDPKLGLDDSVTELITRADQAMYKDKELRK